MVMRFGGWAAALLILVFSPAACVAGHDFNGCAPALPAPQLAQAPAIDDVARLLAGLAVADDSGLAAVARTQVWQRYARQLETSFAKLESQQLAPMRKWRGSVLAEHPASHGPVFYPFSGPDLVYLLNLFPEAHTYVLTGLEPIGKMPALDAANLPGLERRLRSVSRALYALLEFSFFRTNDLSANLEDGQADGVLPILLLFLERMDYQILAVERFRLDVTGQWCALDEFRLQKSDVAGVRLHFLRRGERVVRQLVYLSADIGDAGLARTPQYEAYIRALDPQAVLYKSASYLPHKPYFSRIRALSLQQARLLLQDDSGIPLKSFDPALWDRQLYGRYAGPIALFSNMRQSDLSAAFAEASPPVLPFSYGYQHRRGTSGLMLFIKRVPPV